MNYCTVFLLKVPNYSPRDVMENIKRRIRGEGFVELQPWYNGFAGTITVRLPVSWLVDRQTDTFSLDDLF